MLLPIVSLANQTEKLGAMGFFIDENRISSLFTWGWWSIRPHCSMSGLRAALKRFGLPYLLIPDAGAIREGDDISIDLAAGIVIDATTVREFKFDPYPSFLIDLLAADGLK